ncbi:MAG: amidohydrolase [Halioglobus sp.]
MSQYLRSFLLLSSALLLACSAREEGNAASALTDAAVPIAAEVAADVIYTNGKVYTVNEAQPWAQAMAIRNGMFMLVGSNADVQALAGEATTIVDLDGQMVLPGLIDTHNHATGASMGKANLYLQNPNDAEAIVDEIKAFAEENPDLPYIRGEAWNLGVFDDNSPRKEVLDAIVPDRPVYLYSQTGHDAWVNSKTLELIGITAESEQDNRYIWDVDPQTNEPTGTIREYAMSLVEQALGATDAARIAPHLESTLVPFSEQGFTSIKLAEGEITWVQAANILDESGDLNMRLFPSWFLRAHNGAMSPEQAFEVAGRWQDFESSRVYPRYVKMYVDGSSGSHSTLLLEDYSDRPGDKGSLSFPYETYLDDFTRINSMGLGLIVHVFGDGSSVELVNAFEEVRKRNGDNGAPLHFSHSFMTRPAEIQRLAGISDVCMDFMTLQYPHPAIKEYFVGGIGEERYQQWLNVKAAVEAGVPYSFGSDWPASLEPQLNGFFQMQGFVTRRNPDDPDYGALNPDQAITLEQAVWGFTQGGAECLGFDWPEKVGSIEAGKLADFIVIDREIFSIPIQELKSTQVEMTVVGGEVVFKRG